MRQKKTVRVESIKNFANQLLASPNFSQEEKLGIITMVEKVLHEANAYRGFAYLQLEPNGQGPSLDSPGWCLRKYY